MIIFSLEELNSPPRASQLIRNMATAKSGCIVFSGQERSGKTTIMFTVAAEIAKSGKPIHVLVPRGDYDSFGDFYTTGIPDDWSVSVYDDTAEEFEKTLSAATGQQSLIVLCDADERSVNWGFRSAIEGELVLLCAHTPFAGIDIGYALRAYGIPIEPIVNGLAGIVSQLLFSKLCTECRDKKATNLATTRLIFPDANEPEELWTEIGCDSCGQRGTEGTIAANELLHVTDRERPKIQEYLESNTYPAFSSSVYQSIFDNVRGHVVDGAIGIGTYKQEVLSNPLFRGHHLMEAEQARSAEINDMFSRFVTKEVVDRLITERKLESLLKGEKRKVTCMFCDIRGSSKLAEQMPPNLLFDLLNTYFSQLIDVVFRYEGTIEKFTGDGLLILFGAPLDQDDQETRAVDCAIEIQKAILHLAQLENFDYEIKMGIGINTGEVVAGCIGNRNRMIYTALGDAVNAASRLESKAKADQILIGPETHDAVAQTYQSRSLGTLELRGKDLPLECFEIIWIQQ